MNERLTGVFIPGNSVLHRLDARAKLICLFVLIAVVILADSIAGYALALGFTALLVIISKLPFSLAAASVKRMFAFFVLIFIMNALFFSSDNPIWSGWIISLSKKGMVQGFNVVFRVAVILLIANVFSLVTPPLEITHAIQALLKPFKLVGLPADEIAMIISVAIQFIPILLHEADTVKKAQIARGARFESRKLHERAAAMLPLIVPMFLSAFKKADELAMAMEARGYRGEKYRTHRRYGDMKPNSYFAILICCALCAAEIVL